MADANKTELTLRTTEAAANWLTKIGAKAIETEVGVADGWIADLAAFWSPTRTEAQKSHLLRYRPKDRSHYDGISKVWRKDPDYEEAYKDWEAEYIPVCRQMTLVHEVKTSRSDFKRDDKWTRPAVADLQVLSYVKGIVKPDELPVGWWHLEHSESGKLLRASKCPVVHDVSDKQRLWVVSAIAERRHNRTQYAWRKDIQQTHRNRENERINCNRLSDCANICLDILDGKSVKDALGWLGYGKDNKLPGYVLEKLEKLANRRRDEQARQHSSSDGHRQVAGGDMGELPAKALE